MSKHEHVTFSSGRDVLEHAIRYLTWIRDALDELRERQHGERVRMLLESVEAEQRNLLGSLERLVEDASREALNTYTQYTVELPSEVHLPEEPLTNLGFIQWLQEYNRPLYQMFARLSEHEDSDEASELFGGLAQQVEAHERRVSKEYQRTEDL